MTMTTSTVSPAQSLSDLIKRRRLTLAASALLATLGSGLGLIPYYLIYRIAVETIGQPATPSIRTRFGCWLAAQCWW